MFVNRPVVAMALALTGLCAPARAEEWRMAVARDEVVAFVDADTVRASGAQVAFRSAVFWQEVDETGAVGNTGNVTIDCARRQVKSPGLQDIRPDGSQALTLPEKTAFTKIVTGSVGDVLRDRMCQPRWNKDIMNGVPIDVAPATAAKAAFGLLALGLTSDQASSLASLKYWDEGTLTGLLDANKISAEQRDAVRRVLAPQTVPAPPVEPAIVADPAIVATGLVGKYSHSEHELIAGLWLRADGTFRYGLTVGSLDEAGAGRWTVSEGHVTLTSDPRPVPPAIAAGQSSAQAGPLAIRVVAPTGRDVPGVDFTLEFDTGEPLQSYSPGDVWQLPPSEKRVARFITFAWASYGLRPTRLPIDGRAGRLLTFDFTPNDMGVLDMTGMTADVRDGTLRLQRPEGVMQFSKEDESEVSVQTPAPGN